MSQIQTSVPACSVRDDELSAGERDRATPVDVSRRGSEMMRAAVYNGKGDIAVTDLAMPVVGERDVVVRNLCAGVCGSDVSVYLHGPQAHRITAGSEFGHEVISEVVAKGALVHGLEVGDRVYPYPLLAKGDTSRAGTLGGFSEYMLIPNAEIGRQLYRVDPRVPVEVAAMIEPFTVGTHAARRARPVAGEKAIVFGAGTIGSAAAIALRRLGCDPIMVVDCQSVVSASSRRSASRHAT
jgi:threonine dehydrogenase-like Zn-dependent dehydrogenase